ncbi:PhzF family phenazine biosynthesis protein [Occallatibacter riparius]|uniref:PhzF family phenazine biosynthesis protein n=1 Tax=Occallatibacter riparius TaxID=1002689 RepID=A0A9J7BNH3_9BACT|nr:PhzF family phenazine biosynthesis protein [Occallatibacter riparius]UWZ84272.1 PhzF family phenazine biosynthesis protein [Occallatibacter riparius]
MSAVLEYYIADVFSSEAFAGNPLAVVMNTAGLSTEQMQTIAKEFNLSETTFVERRAAEVEAGEGVRVRIFTTEEELPFAGHPTLGTASVLKLSAPETVRDETVKLAENVGPIPVRFSGDGLYGEMTQRDPEFGAELDRGEVAGLCGLGIDDLDARATPQVVSTGTAFAIVLLRSVEALRRLRVNQNRATAWLRARGARWFYVMAPEGDEAQGEGASFRSRMQFYGGEDPATGSAAGCAISYLVGKGIVRPDEKVLVRQGMEIGRPSELFLTAHGSGVRVTDVRVAGSTIVVAKGQLFLP